MNTQLDSLEKRAWKVFEYSKAVSMQAFADKCGFGLSSVQKLKASALEKDLGKNSKVNLGKINIDKILAAFPEVNKNWLLFGQGSMLTKEYVVNEPVKYVAEHKSYNSIHTTQDDTESYPTITTNAKKAFINYYEQMSLINKLMQSKQEEYQEVYEHLIK